MLFPMKELAQLSNFTKILAFLFSGSQLFFLLTLAVLAPVIFNTKLGPFFSMTTGTLGHTKLYEEDEGSVIGRSHTA